MKILEELWYNGLHPGEMKHSSDRSYKKYLDETIENEDKLLSLLPEEAKEAFKKFDDSREEMAAINRSKIFIAGFRLGAKIMLEVMEQDDKK